MVKKKLCKLDNHDFCQNKKEGVLIKKQQYINLLLKNYEKY